jgi:hypothetical protein
LKTELRATRNCDYRQPKESALYASKVSLSSIISPANHNHFIFSKEHFLLRLTNQLSAAAAEGGALYAPHKSLSRLFSYHN